MGKLSTPILLIVYAIFFIEVTYAQCKWTVDGYTLNLEPLQGEHIITEDNTGHAFNYSICANAAGTCDGKSEQQLMCKQTVPSNPSLCYEVARWDPQEMPTYDADTLTFQFKYNSGDTCDNQVRNFIPKFTCSPSTHLEFSDVYEPEVCSYYLNIRTQYACPEYTATELLQYKQELQQHEDNEPSIAQLKEELIHCEQQKSKAQEIIADLHQKSERIAYLEQKTFYEDIFILLVIGIAIIYYVTMYSNNFNIKKHNNMNLNRYKQQNIMSQNQNQYNMNRNGYTHRNVEAIEMQLSFKELDGIPKRNLQQTLQLLSKDIAVEIIQNYNAVINNKNVSIFQSNKAADKVQQLIYNYLMTASTEQYEYNQQIQIILPFESVKLHAIMTVVTQDNGNTVDLKAKVMSKTLEFPQ